MSSAKSFVTGDEKIVILPLMYKYFRYQKLFATPKGPPSPFFSVLRKVFDIVFCDIPLYGLPKFGAREMVNTRNTQNFSVTKLPKTFRNTEGSVYEIFRYCRSKKIFVIWFTQLDRWAAPTLSCSHFVSSWNCWWRICKCCHREECQSAFHHCNSELLFWRT